MFLFFNKFTRCVLIEGVGFLSVPLNGGLKNKHFERLSLHIWYF